MQSLSLQPSRAWGSYCSSLQKRPLLTKSVTSVAGFALGDCIAQISSSKSQKYDISRTVRMATFGGLLAGPLGHYWYGMLDKSVFPESPRSLKAILTKVVVDQVVWAPVGACLFFGSTKTMQGQHRMVIPTLKDKFLPTMASNYKLWPAAHLVNFAFVPDSQRILYINLVSILWTSILSKAAAEHPTSPPIEPAYGMVPA